MKNISKKSAILIRVSDEIMQGIIKIANKQKWSWNQTGEEAIKFYLKARKVIDK